MKINPPFTPAVCITAGTTAAYLVLYTGYSKADKTIDLKGEYSKFFKSNAKYQLNQLNKVAGLAALSVLAIGSLMTAPEQKETRAELIKHASGISLVHGLYSVWQYRGKFALSEKPIPMGLGILAAFATYQLSLAENVHSTCPMWAAAAVGLATTHFYTMELDKDGKLAVRPFAFTAMVLGLLAGAQLLRKAVL